MAQKKKAVVLEHGGGRMANQLWNDAAIYAFALERGYYFESWASFEYHDYFQIPPVKNWFVRLAFFNFLVRQKAARRFVKKTIYGLFAGTVKFLKTGNVVIVGQKNFFLPPSGMADTEYLGQLSSAENSAARDIYFFGWLFRNPAGLKKYREEVAAYFRPKTEIAERVEKFFVPLQSKFEHIVGVHFRQGDFKKPLARSYFYFTEEEVRKILDGYLEFARKDSGKTLFLIASDEPFKESAFEGLNIERCPGGEIEDLLTLSKTDIVIGSKSTYGDFAAYYGNIPFVVFERDGVEWDYYRDKTEYFENKKSNLNVQSGNASDEV